MEDLSDKDLKLAKEFKDVPGSSNEKARLAKEKVDKANRAWDSAINQFKDRAKLEENRRDFDPEFASDLGRISYALDKLYNDFKSGKESPEKVLKDLDNIKNAFRTLENGHDVAEAAKALKDMANQERWPETDMKTLTKHPKDWDWIKERLRLAPDKFKRTDVPKDIPRKFSNVLNDPLMKKIDAEMANRQSARRVSSRLKPEDIDKFRNSLEKAGNNFLPEMKKARKAVKDLAPSISNMMDSAAGDLDKLKKETKDIAGRIKGNNFEQVRDRINDLIKKQDDINKKINDLKGALRRDANAQDVKDKKGRERMRDADDSIGMLHYPSKNIQNALKDAAIGREKEDQGRALRQAAAEQTKLSKNLKDLADHYNNLEKGEGKKTRGLLRQAEEKRGVKEALDSEYKRIEGLAEMAEKSPEKVLEKLEKILADNEAMRNELNSIVQNKADRAGDKLKDILNMHKEMSNRINALEKRQENQKKQISAKYNNDLNKKMDRLKGLMAEIDKEAGNVSSKPNEEFKKAVNNFDKVTRRMPDNLSKPSQITDEQMKSLGQPLNKAYEDVEKTANKLGEALKKASQQQGQQQAGQQQQGQKGEQQAGQNDNLEAVYNKVNEAAGLAKDISNETQKLMKAMKRQNENSMKSMIPMAVQYKIVSEAVPEVSSNFASIARHKNRLGRQEDADRYKRLAGNIDNSNADEVNKAKNILGKGVNPKEANDYIDKAQNSLGNVFSDLMSPDQTGSNQGVEEQTEDIDDFFEKQNYSDDEIKWLARTLDDLDNEIYGKEFGAQQGGQQQSGQQQSGQQQGQQSGQQQAGQQGGQQSSGGGNKRRDSGYNPIKNALESGQNAMRLSRAKGGVPGETNQNQPNLSSDFQDSSSDGSRKGDTRFSSEQGGSSVAGRKNGTSRLPKLKDMKDEDWAKLPPKMAKDLNEALREKFSDEYRDMIETYFSAIAKKAREKGK
jgi:hypothetical protein